MSWETLGKFINEVDVHIKTGARQIEEENKEFDLKRAVILDKRKALKNEIYELLNN